MLRRYIEIGGKHALFVSEKAAAKINLTLDTLYKRKDGYHELEMVMTTIDLSDRLDLWTRKRKRITLESSSGLVPQDERNLAYRAAKLLQERYHVQQGVHIRIHKKIPVAAGLAGGSSDAAAALRACNRLWGLNLSIKQLAKIGAEIGSDVPFCVYGGTALAKGRGDRITLLPPPPHCWVVLAKPPRSVSTADVYQRLHVDQIKKRPRTAAMVEALKKGDYDQMIQYLGNVLEPITMSIYPEVRLIKERMKSFGADGALMSGSGPTLFALVSNETRANRLYNSLRGFCQQVYKVRIRGRESIT